MAYRQTVIPEVTTPEGWKGLSRDALRTASLQYYNQNIKGTVVTNEHLGLAVEFTTVGIKKTVGGGAMYPNKAVCVLILPEMMRVAVYNNFGPREDKHPASVAGHFNFKCKVRIDGMLHHMRITARLYKDRARLFYNMDSSVKR